MREIPLRDIQAAAASVYDLVVRTPLIRLDLPLSLARQSAGEIYLKLETLQPVGSFKIRGAHNALRQLPPDEIRDGVWTVSAGNAALGVALAARHAGVPCSVMVMDTAPAAKLDAIRRLGATIVSATYEECWRTVEAHGAPGMKGRFLHPFDDDRFIAGNGTAGLEILEDLPDVAAIVGAVGGGGCSAAWRRPCVRSVLTCRSSPPSPRRPRPSTPRSGTAAPAASRAGGPRSWTEPAAGRYCRPCGRCSSGW
jgi:threonine dehydratase